MARAYLNWSIRDLAHAATVAPNTVSAFENGQPARADTVERLTQAFSERGLAFYTTGVDFKLARQ